MSDEIDYSDSFTIKLTKVKYNGKFIHWEVDMDVDQIGGFMEGTSPTFWGALDMATEYLWEESEEGDWLSDDANRPN